MDIPKIPKGEFITIGGTTYFDRGFACAVTGHPGEPRLKKSRKITEMPSNKKKRHKIKNKE